MLKSSLRTLSFAILAVAASANAAVTFSNITFSGSATAVANPATLTSGASVTTSGNSLTFDTPNARVGIGASTGVTDGSVLLQYDACVTGGSATLVAWSVDTAILGFLAGSGSLYFQEDVFELDTMGNEVGQIGHLSKSWTAASPQSVWSGHIDLSKNVECLRVKKFFYLDASDDTPGLDRSVLGKVNQTINVVPEPASMVALGAGVLAFVRKRRSK